MMSLKKKYQSFKRYVDHWGTTEAERALVYPCDLLMPSPQGSLFRGIEVRANPDIVHRWLCQMKVAPYSYDWIDNLGRQSPRHLIPGLEQLSRGQVFMFVFKLVDFDPRQITLRAQGRLMGDVLISYVVVEAPTRLLVKVAMNFPRGPVGWLLRSILPWGDWIMMRKQLLTFKQLAEQEEPFSEPLNLKIPQIP